MKMSYKDRNDIDGATSDLLGYVKDNSGYIKVFAIYFKYYPFLDKMPSILTLMKPITLYQDFGMVLFTSKGHIIALNKISAVKFSLRKEIVSKRDNTNNLIIFDVFSNLKECLQHVSKNSSKEAFFHLEYNYDIVKKYVTLTKVTNNENIDNKSEEYEEDNQNEIKSDSYSNTKTLKMIANINFADETNQDIFVMYFNTPLHQANSTDNNDIIKDLQPNNSRSFTDRTSHFSENSFLMENETLNNLTGDGNRTSSRRTNMASFTSLQRNRLQLYTKKNDQGKTSQTKRQGLLALISMLLIIIALSLFIVSMVFTRSITIKNGTFIALDYKYTAVSINLWKAAYYTRRLDILYKSDEFNVDVYNIYREELSNSISIFQEYTKDLVSFHQQYIAKQYTDMDTIYVDYTLSYAKFSDRIYPVNAFLQLITYCDNIYNDNNRSFVSMDSFSSLYFVVKSGITGIYVS